MSERIANDFFRRFVSLATLSYGSETWEFRERDKARITPTEMKFMRRTAKYTSQDYKTNEDILSGLKIQPSRTEN
jgi:hypothetical protein